MKRFIAILAVAVLMALNGAAIAQQEPAQTGTTVPPEQVNTVIPTLKSNMDGNWSIGGFSDGWRFKKTKQDPAGGVEGIIDFYAQTLSSYNVPVKGKWDGKNLTLEEVTQNPARMTATMSGTSGDLDGTLTIPGIGAMSANLR